MATKEEYRHVLADLLKIRMFTGIYDVEIAHDLTALKHKLANL